MEKLAGHKLTASVKIDSLLTQIWNSHKKYEKLENWKTGDENSHIA